MLARTHLFKISVKLVASKLSSILPSSIFRTSRRLFMIEDMKLVHIVIESTSSLTAGSRIGGMTERAMSMAWSGLRNSWAKYAVMFRCAEPKN